MRLQALVGMPSRIHPKEAGHVFFMVEALNVIIISATCQRLHQALERGQKTEMRDCEWRVIGHQKDLVAFIFPTTLGSIVSLLLGPFSNENELGQRYFCYQILGFLRVLKGCFFQGRGCSWGTLRIPFGKIGEH